MTAFLCQGLSSMQGRHLVDAGVNCKKKKTPSGYYEMPLLWNLSPVTATREHGCVPPSPFTNLKERVCWWDTSRPAETSLFKLETQVRTHPDKHAFRKVLLVPKTTKSIPLFKKTLFDPRSVYNRLRHIPLTGENKLLFIQDNVLNMGMGASYLKFNGFINAILWWEYNSLAKNELL